MTMTINSNSVLLIHVIRQASTKVLNIFKTFVLSMRILFIPGYAHWKRAVIFFVAQLTCCILVILTVYYVIRACNISQENCEIRRIECECDSIMLQSHCAESTAERGWIDHLCLIGGSFLVILAMTMTMTINSNSVLLVRVASAGRYESFEHVQNVCVHSSAQHEYFSFVVMHIENV